MNYCTYPVKAVAIVKNKIRTPIDQLWINLYDVSTLFSSPFFRKLPKLVSIWVGVCRLHSLQYCHNNGLFIIALSVAQESFITLAFMLHIDH